MKLRWERIAVSQTVIQLIYVHVDTASQKISDLEISAVRQFDELRRAATSSVNPHALSPLPPPFVHGFSAFAMIISIFNGHILTNRTNQASDMEAIRGGSVHRE
jgi:hypothetical protein